MAVRLVIGPNGWRKHRRVGSGRTVQAAIPMLPPDIQAAVTAALREDAEDSTQSLGARPADRSGGAQAPVPPGVPPYLFVVRSGQVLTFNSLRKLAWARPDLLGVVFDRRWMGERRSQDRPGHAERRCTERRRPAPESNWSRRGFLLASAGKPFQPASAPSPGPASHKTVSSERDSVGAPPRPPPRGRAIALGLGAVLMLGAVSAAGFYLRSSDRSTTLTDSALSGEPHATPPSAPTATVRPKPRPVLTAPEPVMALPPSEPRPAPLAPRGQPPAVARPVAPAEPTGGAGVAVDPCVTPTSPMVALRGEEVLGVLVGAKIDADSQPPRCWYVVKRAGGALWLVDSARVQIRPR